MTSYLYAVYDRLANSFGALVEYHTDGAAIRDFKRMYDKGVTADPSQYELHKIGKVVRTDPDSNAACLSVGPVDKSVIYNYAAYASERLDSNGIFDQIALLSDEDFGKLSDFVKTLKGGNENGSK